MALLTDNKLGSRTKLFGLTTSQILLIVIAITIAAYISRVFWAFASSKSRSQKPLPAKLANNKNRKPGHWVPEDFVTPKPEPAKGWSVEKTKPLPYRPFRHNYKVTMGIRSMDWNDWIELDNEWPKYHQRKLDRLRERGELVYRTAPEAYDAAIELLMEFREFLPARYPSMFKKTDVGIDNLYNGESFNIMERPLKEDPMVIAAKLVQDDLAIMIEKEDGQYYLLAGAIILAGFWKLTDKLGMPLSEIHTSGDVPKYNEKLKAGMEKFFTRLRPEAPVNRNNYFFQNDDDLGWSYSIGSEDGEKIGWYTAQEAKAVKDVYFRSERQSLRRLPKTGAVVFTIRTYFLPVVEMANEPHVPRRLLNSLSDWDKDVQNYKGYEKFKDVLLPYLELKAKEQEEKGIEEPERAYPY